MGNCVKKFDKAHDPAPDTKYHIENTDDYKYNDCQNSKSRSNPTTPHLIKSDIGNKNASNAEKRNSANSLVNSAIKANQVVNSNSNDKVGMINDGVLNNSAAFVTGDLKKGGDSPGRRSETMLRNIMVNGNVDFSNSRHLIAIFDYNEQNINELTLRKGNRYFLLDSSDNEWWTVEENETGRRGYVPAPFLAPEFSFEAEDWYFRNITRKDSERCLLQRGNARGCFLIRASETTQGALCLSVLDKQPTQPSSSPHSHPNQITPGCIVNHYKIKRTTQDSMFYITTKRLLPSLKALVQFYSSAANGLCCALTHPCPRPLPLLADLSHQTKDKWEIDRSSLQLIEELGSGQFGKVWKGLWNNTTWVAIKTLKQGSMSKEEFLKEARTMKGLCHMNLVRLFAICSEDPIYIVTEFMSKGSLLDFLRSDVGKGLLLKQLLDFISQIANGMAYLETHGYVHRDLAARNILVSEGDVCKVADFGLARILDSNQDLYEAREGTKFPVKWTAPEAALLGKFSTKSDVWSFGILVMEVMTKGQIPYPSMNNNDALRNVENGYRMPRPPNCPAPVYEACLQCWHERSDLRPTFASLRDLFDDLFTNAESGYRAAECISR